MLDSHVKESRRSLHRLDRLVKQRDPSPVPTAAAARRKEAQRNLETILEAAVEVLGRRPDANMTDVARASGVSRQTVYAHFASREQLIDAAVGRAMEHAVARIDSVSPDEGRAEDALRRVLDISWSSVATHGALLDAALAALPPETLHARHAPVVEPLRRLIERGQAGGEFDPDVPAAWLLATFFALVHAAGQEVTAGRLEPDAAAAALRATVPRAFRT